MLVLKTITSDQKLEQEMLRYEEQMKSFLPIENQLKKLKRDGKRLEEIKSALGNNSTILDYVPTILYHGSLENLSVINPQESTQKGAYVYATDNPIHALFFSVCSLLKVNATLLLFTFNSILAQVISNVSEN